MRGDGKYDNQALAAYLADGRFGYKVALVKRPAGVAGLVHLPSPWVIETNNGRTGKYRQNSKDYGRSKESALAMAQVLDIHLMLQRLKPDTAS